MLVPNGAQQHAGPLAQEATHPKMSALSKQTFSCHTDSSPSQRSILLLISLSLPFLPSQIILTGGLLTLFQEGFMWFIFSLGILSGNEAAPCLVVVNFNYWQKPQLEVAAAVVL